MNSERQLKKVKTFFVYDRNNPADKELIKMNKFLAKHTEYETHWFNQQGPCSNWGYDVFRPETDGESDKRMRREEKKRARMNKVRSTKKFKNLVKNFEGIAK